jgi:hypothetical protein
MAGLVPAIHVLLAEQLNQCVVQIVPFGIHRMDQTHFPRTRPVLDDLLSLYGVSDVVEELIVDKSLEAYRFVKPAMTPSRCSKIRRGMLAVTPAYKMPSRRFVMI